MTWKNPCPWMATSNWLPVFCEDPCWKLLCTLDTRLPMPNVMPMGVYWLALSWHAGVLLVVVEEVLEVRPVRS